MKRNRKHKRRRGISFGTILMLVLTIVIGGGCLTLLPRLQGNTELHVDTSQMLSDLTLNGSMPQLSLSDIPITVTTAAPAKAAATPIPTMQPEVQQLLSTSTPSVQTATLTFGGSINVESGIRKSGYFSETKTYDFDDVMSLAGPRNANRPVRGSLYEPDSYQRQIYRSINNGSCSKLVHHQRG